MNEQELQRLKKIPLYLIPGRGKRGTPGLIKRHVAQLCFAINDEWRLFSEGCLRNRYFRGQVLKRSTKCRACERKLDTNSRIEQHHNDYLWSCIGSLLPENSDDVHRKPRAEEFPDIPDCRQCHIDNPDHFQECVKRINGIHAACHERVHSKERYFRDKSRENLIEQFNVASLP